MAVVVAGGRAWRLQVGADRARVTELGDHDGLARRAGLHLVDGAELDSDEGAVFGGPVTLIDQIFLPFFVDFGFKRQHLIQHMLIDLYLEERCVQHSHTDRTLAKTRHHHRLNAHVADVVVTGQQLHGLRRELQAHGAVGLVCQGRVLKPHLLMLEIVVVGWG